MEVPCTLVPSPGPWGHPGHMVRTVRLCSTPSTAHGLLVGISWAFESKWWLCFPWLGFGDPCPSWEWGHDLASQGRSHDCSTEGLSLPTHPDLLLGTPCSTQSLPILFRGCKSFTSSQLPTPLPSLCWPNFVPSVKTKTRKGVRVVILTTSVYTIIHKHPWGKGTQRPSWNKEVKDKKTKHKLIFP